MVLGTSDSDRDDRFVPEPEGGDGDGNEGARGRGLVTRTVTLVVIGSPEAPFSLSAGSARIGFDTDNDLVLQSATPRQGYAEVTIDQDGVMLRLGEPNPGVRLNQRPVESLAFLHDGDVIDIAGFVITVQIQAEVASGHDPRSEDRSTRVRRVPPKYVLRGTAGARFGKLIPIYGRLVIGRDSDCDLILDDAGLSRRHAIIETLPDGLFLRDLGSANGSFVNGVRVRDSVLHHGDQIILDSVRFVVQSIDQLEGPGGDASASTARRPAHAGALRWVVLASLGVAAVAVVVALLLR